MPSATPRHDTGFHARLTPAARAAAGAALFGVTVGLAVGGAYLMGASARGAAVKQHANRFDTALSAGFTDEALAAAAGGLDESALAIARRHDPYAVTAPWGRDRQAELMAARLSPVQTQDAGLRSVSSGTPGPAARPVRLGALDASRDLECLTQAVYYEARGEGRDGMRAVAQVVLNRTRHSAFPRTVCGVVYQGSGRRTGCQFSFTCDGSMRGRVNRTAWDRARQVASEALNGAVYAPVGSATHFHTTRVSPGWRGSLIRVGQVGDHVFYRFGGRAGSRGAFAQDPQPSLPTPVLGAEVIEASYETVAPLSLTDAAPSAPVTTRPNADARSAAPSSPEAVSEKTPGASVPAQASSPRPASPRPAAATIAAPAHDTVAPAA